MISFAVSSGRNVLIDYYIPQSALKSLSFFGNTFLKRMFEGGLEEIVGGALNLVLAALRSYRAWLVAAAAGSIHINSKVAQEGFLCEGHASVQDIPPSLFWEKSVWCRAAGLRSFSSGAAAADRLLRHSSGRVE
jgi:hypothetical protein